MPRDLSDGTVDSVGILKDHLGLCGDRLDLMLWGFTLEVLFEKVDLVVLANALLRGSYQVLGCGRKTEVSVSVHFLIVLSDVGGLSGVETIRPSSFDVLHSSFASGNTLCVDLNKV